MAFNTSTSEMVIAQKVRLASPLAFYGFVYLTSFTLFTVRILCSQTTRDRVHTLPSKDYKLRKPYGPFVLVHSAFICLDYSVYHQYCTVIIVTIITVILSTKYSHINPDTVPICWRSQKLRRKMVTVIKIY